MLISPKRLQRFWRIHPEVVMHIGAHKAEELRDYADLGWGSQATVWLEALPHKAEYVKELVADLPHHTVITAVVWDKAGETIEFNETNNGQSSSALKLKDTAGLYPHIVVTEVVKRVTSTVADLVDFDALGRVGLVNLDIQGAELRALQGFGANIALVDAVYAEVNVRELYEGCAMLPDVDEWMSGQGFTRVDWVILPGVGWGDALWVRNAHVPRNAAARRFVRRVLDIPSALKFRLFTVYRRINPVKLDLTPSR